MKDREGWKKIGSSSAGEIWIGSDGKWWYLPRIKHMIQKKRQKECPPIEISIK